MASSYSSRDMPTDKRASDKPASKGFLFFGRKQSTGNQATTAADPKVGIFSARSLRQDPPDSKPQGLKASNEVLSMKDTGSGTKAANLNFLNRHMQKSFTNNDWEADKLIAANQAEASHAQNSKPTEVRTADTQASMTKRSVAYLYNSPRGKGAPEIPQSDFMFKFGPKMNYGEATEILVRKGSATGVTSSATGPNDPKRTNLASFLDSKAKEKRNNVNVQFEVQNSVELTKHEPKTSQRGFPWRVFSFEKKDKTKTEVKKSEISSMVTPVKNPLGDLKLNSASKKTHEGSPLAKNKSFSNLQIKPNYYMKSLEYYFLLEKNDYFSRIYKEHFQLSFNSIKFVKLLDKEAADTFARSVKLNLKKKVFYKDKKTIIFDLDETLVHCTDSKDLGDVNITITFPNGNEIEASIFLRPHVKETLESLSKHFEIIVFTASHRGYADKVIDILDPTGEFVSHRLFREHCFQSKQGVYVKDLRVINRRLEDILLVDNALYSYGLQLTNGVPIIPFYNCKEDAELLILSEYLMSLRDEPDVREINNHVFKYDCLREADNITNCFMAMFNPQKNKRGTSASKRNQSIGPKS